MLSDYPKNMGFTIRFVLATDRCILNPDDGAVPCDLNRFTRN